MSKILEEMIQEAEKRGEIRGEERIKVQVANDMIEYGEIPLEKIAKITQLTIDRVRELAAQKAVPNS